MDGAQHAHRAQRCGEFAGMGRRDGVPTPGGWGAGGAKWGTWPIDCTIHPPTHIRRGFLRENMEFRGRFRTARAQRGHSANYYGVHPGNTPETPPPYRRVHDPFKTASGVWSSGPWDPWLPVVEDSRLFARRAHSAVTAHGAPPYSTGCRTGSAPAPSAVHPHEIILEDFPVAAASGASFRKAQQRIPG